MYNANSSNRMEGSKPDSVRHLRPYLREGIRQILGTRGMRLEKFVDERLKLAPNVAHNYFSKVASSDQANSAIALFAANQADAIKSKYEIWISDKDRINKVFTDELAPTHSGKPVLRSRFILPGADDFKEPPKMNVMDVVNSELFSWNTTNPGLGIYNGVYIGNLKNDRILYEPKSWGIEDAEDMLIHKTEGPWSSYHFGVMQEEPPLASVIDDSAREGVQEYIGLHGPSGVSMGLQDQYTYRSALTGKLHTTYLAPEIEEPPPFQNTYWPADIDL